MKQRKIHVKKKSKSLQRDLERKRKLMDAQVIALQAEYTAKEEEVKQLINQEKRREKAVDENKKEMGRMRKADNK